MHLMFENKLSLMEESNQKQINSFIEENSKRQEQAIVPIQAKATPPRPPLP